MEFNILILFLLVIVGVSIKAFGDAGFMERLMYIPYLVKRDKQYYRIASHMFIHADWAHLAFNGISLYFLGDAFLNAPFNTYVGIDGGLIENYGSLMGQAHFATLFLLGGLFASIVPFIRNHDNPSYRSLGASGAVSSVIFAAILWNPQMELMLFFIPIAIPAYIFGPLYLLFEFIMDKRGGGRIAHDAHIGGAIFGILYVLIINIDKGKDFLNLFFG